MLRGTGLHLSVAPGLDGVANVAVVIDPVPHRGTSRRKAAPSLLSGLGTLGPWPVRAVAEGVTAAPRHLRGVSIEATPVGGGHR